MFWPYTSSFLFEVSRRVQGRYPKVSLCRWVLLLDGFAKSFFGSGLDGQTHNISMDFLHYVVEASVCVAASLVLCSCSMYPRL